MGNDFAGVTASHYATYRRDVPDVLIEAVVRAAGLTDRDIALDLGCGTGQIAIPLAGRVGLVMAVDPEPAMLAGLRARATATRDANVLPVLAADRELPIIATVWAASPGVVTVGNALRWMDAPHVFAQSRGLLRVGGALVIISQGPPMWLSDADWSHDLRVFLERWTGETLSATCGTDRWTLEQRARGLREDGYERVEVVEHAYENEVDLTYIAGHLRSAMSESTLPREREAEFRDRLTDSLRPHLRTGTVTERIRVNCLDRNCPHGLQSEPYWLSATPISPLLPFAKGGAPCGDSPWTTSTPVRSAWRERKSRLVARARGMAASKYAAADAKIAASVHKLAEERRAHLHPHLSPEE